MRSSSASARVAILLGALAVLAIPAAVAAAQYLSGIPLLRALYVGVPIAFALGLIAVLTSRRARLALSRSLHPERRKLVRSARVVAWAGLYVGVTGALALGVYGVLRWAQ
jgi:ABC-type transport system involved in cytochrome c biogenesis permease subunit